MLLTRVPAQLTVPDTHSVTACHTNTATPAEHFPRGHISTSTVFTKRSKPQAVRRFHKRATATGAHPLFTPSGLNRPSLGGGQQFCSGRRTNSRAIPRDITPADDWLARFFYTHTKSSFRPDFQAPRRGILPAHESISPPRGNPSSRQLSTSGRHQRTRCSP